MKIELFIDEETEARASFDPPGQFDLDTSDLCDGPHVLIVRANDAEGPDGLERIPFTVRNGPGIAVFGIREGETLRGHVPILVNAYASRVGDDFEPTRAETPAPVPTWAWVLSLVVSAWALFYITDQYRQHAAELASVAPLGSVSVSARASTTSMAVANGSMGAQSSVSSGASATQRALGEQVYGNYCSACHQQSGRGLGGVFPPLQGDAVVLSDDASEHIRIVLEGLSGKTIGDVVYTAEMPAFGPQLSDEQIAAVINHERTTWGNAAIEVNAQDVNTVRSMTDRP